MKEVKKTLEIIFLWFLSIVVNARLNIQLFSNKKLHCLITLHEDSPSNSFLANIMNGIFSKSKLIVIVKVASYLERKEDYTNQSKTT